MKSYAPQIGQKVTLTHIYIKNKVPYFRVVDSQGRTGWMKGATKSMFLRMARRQRYYYYFREAIVVG